MNQQRTDYISPDTAKTLAGLFRERVRRSGDAVAYRQYDPASDQWRDTSWREAGAAVGRWQAALDKEALTRGDRVAMMMRNCKEWQIFDQAALGMGLVTVPLYNDDRGDNVAYIIQDAGVKLLLIEGEEQWSRLERVCGNCDSLQRVVSLERLTETSGAPLVCADDWLPDSEQEMQENDGAPDELATIVYTSGTTGRPKGVMLSHTNILSNAATGLACIDIYPDDLFLSFLPLSHTLERTSGYYLALMAGGQVAFARSIAELAEDLVNIKPTVMVSVPRIYERVYGRIQAGLQEKSNFARTLFHLAVDVGWGRYLLAQGRGPWKPSFLLWPLLKALVAGKVMARLGGRIRLAICGGAPLSPDVAQTFIGLGLPVLQGYGLTESSPVIAVNRLESNIPASIGPAVPGVEVRIGEQDELLARGPNIMLGYWNNEEATAATVDSEGWLHTGDQARIDDRGHIYITGRLKEIIVLATGEKVPPADMEMAVAMDPLFEQVMILGEGRPYLCALVVLNPEQWTVFAETSEFGTADLGTEALEQALLQHINAQLSSFPGYAQVRRASFTLDPWSIENGLITPTMKMKRARILEHHATDVERMYAGH